MAIAWTLIFTLCEVLLAKSNVDDMTKYEKSLQHFDVCVDWGPKPFKAEVQSAVFKDPVRSAL